MTYLFNSFDNIENNTWQKILEILPNDIYQKILRKKHIFDQQATAIGYLLLIWGLKLEYGIVEQPELFYNEFGKPFLKDYPNIYFNISHTKKIVCCTLSNHEIGIDIEKVKTHSNKLMKFCLDETEYQTVIKEDDPNLAFIKIWTKKESYLKCTGRGISHDLKSCLKNQDQNNVKFNTELLDYNQYVLTICEKVNNDN